MTFSKELSDKINSLLTKYPEGKQKSAVIPALHLIQEMGNNSLTIEQMDTLAAMLHITPIEVYEGATFYTMFNVKPVGK